MIIFLLIYRTRVVQTILRIATDRLAFALIKGKRWSSKKCHLINVSARIAADQEGSPLNAITY